MTQENEIGTPIVAGCPATGSSGASRWVRLAEVARLESGHTPSRRRADWWGGDVRWLALPDIRKLHGGYAYETVERINEAGIANSSARMLPPGTVCVSRTASIGFVTILGREMATSQDFCNWVCGPGIDPGYLMLAFMASQEYLQALGSGAVHKTIYMPTIQTLHIALPSIDTQRSLAESLLLKLVAANDVVRRIADQLEEAQRLPKRLLGWSFAEAMRS